MDGMNLISIPIKNDWKFNVPSRWGVLIGPSFWQRGLSWVWCNVFLMNLTQSAGPKAPRRQVSRPEQHVPSMCSMPLNYFWPLLLVHLVQSKCGSRRRWRRQLVIKVSFNSWIPENDQWQDALSSTSHSCLVIYQEVKWKKINHLQFWYLFIHSSQDKKAFHHFLVPQDLSAFTLLFGKHSVTVCFPLCPHCRLNNWLISNIEISLITDPVC